MATQLRDYRIVAGSLDLFVEEWRSRIAPIRRETGFTIERAWTVESESRFIWVVSYPGDWSAFAAADRAYYASPARAAIDPDPARLIESQTTLELADVEL
jgi:hypothetical protein